MTFTLIGPAQASIRRPIGRDGRPRFITDYFGRSSSFAGGDAFVIAQTNETLGAHFHPVDQFQILLGAPGSLYQRRAIDPMVVHYADAYTTYGPLIGADPPLRYFTLRAEPTTEIAFMPRDRAKLIKRGRRNIKIPVDAPGELAVLAPGDVRWVEIIAAQSDGLRVAEVTAGPGTPVVLPAATGSGEYSFVAAGSIDFAGRSFGQESLGWHTGGCGQVEVVAGDAGCRLLVFFFPYPSTNSSLDAPVAANVNI
jgi:hypothetical protein